MLLLLLSLATAWTPVKGDEPTRTDSLATILEDLAALARREARRDRDLKRLNEALVSARGEIERLNGEVAAGNEALERRTTELTGQVEETRERLQESTVAAYSWTRKELRRMAWDLALLVVFMVGLFWLGRVLQRGDARRIVRQVAVLRDVIVKSTEKPVDKPEVKVPMVKEVEYPAPDHSLALKLADEITVIERNLACMDEVRGKKQLARSMERLRDNLSAHSYSMPVLLGKTYDEGMKVIIVNSYADERLKPGEEIISKIIKPQVNYNGKMIQAAQIEVSVG